MGKVEDIIVILNVVQVATWVHVTNVVSFITLVGYNTLAVGKSKI
jgi:hypothetical protein